jgi:glyoxylase-like metal-dependent hydrolase (beta-lactamase superfamily II)
MRLPIHRRSRATHAFILAAPLLWACNNNGDPAGAGSTPVAPGTPQTSTVTAAASAPSVATAPSTNSPDDSSIWTRNPENPKLVWTPSSVVLTTKQVAPSVYAVYPDDSASKNAAGIPAATAGGFVVGDRGVLVVESMINRRLALQMLALVKRTTPKPILYVVNTSYHGDHSYGNQFFPRDAQVIQHVNTQAYIQSHFADDVAFMEQYFGKDQGLDELKPQRANVLLPDGAHVSIDLGNTTVDIMHLGFAQTTGDLFVWLPKEKVLFTGNPVISEGPSFSWLLDGRLQDALTTLHKVDAMLPRDAVVVPGHGGPTGVQAIEHHLAYLEELKKRTTQAVAQGMSEKDTVALLTDSMKAYAGYKIYPWVHSQVNVPKTYEDMKGKH